MQQPDQVANSPYLQAAFFCERLLEEADGVMSAIRIVDTITAQGIEQTPQAATPLVHLTLFIAFKAGQARGSYDLTVVMEPPPGRSPTHPGESHTQAIVFEGTEEQGITIIMPIAMTVSEEGVYWFGIYLGERLVTRLPLRVAVLRQMQRTDPQ